MDGASESNWTKRMNAHQQTVSNFTDVLINPDGTFHTHTIAPAPSGLVAGEVSQPHDDHAIGHPFGYEASENKISAIAWVILGIFAAIIIAVCACICIYHRRVERRGLQQPEHDAQGTPVRSMANTTNTSTVSRETIATFPKYTFWRSMVAEPVSPGPSVEGRGEASATGAQQLLGSFHSIELGDPRFGAQASNALSPPQHSELANPSQVAKSTTSGDEQQSNRIPRFPANSWRQIECPICLQHFKHGRSVVRKLPCNHIFHSSCIVEYLTRQSITCPTCRVSVLPPEPMTVEEPEPTPQPVTQERRRPWWRENRVALWVVDRCEDTGIAMLITGVKKGSRAVWGRITYLRQAPRAPAAAASDPPEQTPQNDQELR